VTADDRRVVSASEDRTLKVWDLETGLKLATLEGHAGAVTACAITSDGRYVVSASDDRTLRVWDIDTRACVFIHRGDAVYTAVAAAASTIAAGDVTGGVWFLDWPPSKPGTTPPGVTSGGGSDLAEDSAPPRQRRMKQTILFLAANPIGTDRLALDQEARAIQLELERSGHRDQFELVTRWASQPLDLLRELRKLKPTVVHFSGHGSHGEPAEPRRDDAPRRDVVGESGPRNGKHPRGLFFQGTDGRAQLVSTAALEETFGAAGASVRLVILNACYSEVQAEAILAHVDCVVGMSGSIRDDAARLFAIGFYGGLAERESVATAYKQGRAAISLEGLRDGDRPQLRVRDGIDAVKLVLVERGP
jgi:hypothetical protein